MGCGSFKFYRCGDLCWTGAFDQDWPKMFFADIYISVYLLSVHHRSSQYGRGGQEDQKAALTVCVSTVVVVDTFPETVHKRAVSFQPRVREEAVRTAVVTQATTLGMGHHQSPAVMKE